uniref:Integrase catalytic domain-containing protein n=1 Tax=Tanacetum cinerariifolium TaxID=118510 RepID=A0A6L2NV45_TANCI|nr:hypothetical protein [Tanacetum cinerariifolium]
MTVEIPMNMSPQNKAHFLAEKEAIHLILTGIRDDIYSTVDACQTAQEMWEVIERLQQGEFLNIQDMKTNIFWEFRKFTSHDEESMESYYTRFYKLMNEISRNNLTVTTMQVNVQFLQQLQPKWLRFVTIVKQQHKLDEVSYHKLFDILKQYQNEVNELRAERLARNANPLALVATAQADRDPYYQTSRSHRSSVPSSKPSIPPRSHTSTRNKGKEIAKPITPPSEIASEEDSDPEQAQRDKDIQKNLALIAKYFKRIYKPTNNNLITSSNSKNKNVDTTPRLKNDNQSGQFGNQRTVNVVAARENECRKPKRVKDFTYHKEKMLLCKQAEQGVPLQAEQYDWLAETDEEVDEQELEAHYSYMDKIQEVPTANSCTDSEPVEQTKQAEFEKYKAFNDCTVNYDKLEHKLNEALGQLAHKDNVIREASNVFQKEREQYFEIQDLKAQLQDKNIAISELKKLIEKGKGKSVDTKFDRPSIVRQLNAQGIPKPSVLGKSTPFSDSLKRRYFLKTKSISKANVLEGLSKPVTAQTLPQTVKKAVSNTNVLKPGMYRIDNRTAHTRAPQLPQTVRNTNPCVSTSTGVNHKPNVSRPQLKSNQSRDKVLPNTSQVKIVQLILFIVDSGCTKHMMGNLKLLCNFVEKFLGTVRFGYDQFAPILGYGDLVQGNVTINKGYYVEGLNHNLFSVGQFCDADLESKAVPSLKGRLNLLHMDLCGPMRAASINGKKYIVDDYSRYIKLQALVITVRTDRGTKFLNKTLNAFFKEEGIEHQTSTARTPEQNGVVERQNRTLVEAARTMLSASQLPLFFWAEAITTACYTQNRSKIIPTHGKTPYHIINDRKPSIKHLHIFGCICYITRDGENLDKMKEKGDQCILVGYSTQSKGYRVYNKRTRMIIESIHIRFNEIKEVSETSVANNTLGLVPQRQKASDYDNPDPVLILQRTFSLHQHHQLIQMFMLRRTTMIEQKKENNYKMMNLPILFVLRHKMLLSLLQTTLEEVYVVQPDGFVDPDHLEKVYQIRKVLYGLKQAPRACRFEMSLMGEMKLFLRLQIHQSPRGIFINQAKYTLEILHKHGMDKGQSIGTPMAMEHKLDADLSGNPVDQIDYRSKIRSLMYLTSSRPDIVHALCFCARYQSRPTEKHIKEVKRIFRYLRGIVHMGLWYSKDSSFELTAFSDADLAKCIDSCKSTSGGIQFLGEKLVSWMSKKQNCTVMSSAEAEYVALSASYAQVMWMRTQFQDYGFNYNKIPLYCDSQSAIAISCNPVQHSRTKHIHTRYHFIKEQNWRFWQKNLLDMYESMCKNHIKLTLEQSQQGVSNDVLIVDFLTAHHIQYALLVNPTIYVSCIWASVLIKKSTDAVKFQALIDRKKVLIIEDIIRQALQLDDADGIDCLPNEEIFAELARMGYEKPSTKLTFTRRFSTQWKFLIHMIVQCMSAKTTAWNEFSSFMASTVICLATDDLSSHNTKYTSPALTQKVFANIRRIGKGFSGVETPLFDAMLVPQQVHADVAKVEENEDEDNKVSDAPTTPSPTPATRPSPPQQAPIPSPPQAESTQPSSPPQP